MFAQVNIPRYDDEIYVLATRAAEKHLFMHKKDISDLVTFSKLGFSDITMIECNLCQLQL